MAMKLRREPSLGNPTLVLVTDRRDLDDQISKTFIACGFPNPERAESVRDLRERLKHAVGKTVLTTVQKFQEVTGVPGEKPISREAAATYKETLERLNAPQSALLVSTSNKDDEKLVRLAVRPEGRKATIDRFCDRGDPLAILVVCDMLLTGFDAPVEQVMYLDSPLKEHTLLQAIARVNRPADKKDYGLIVDYCGVSEALQEALAVFSPSDVRGALTPKSDELPRLQARHAVALRFFVGVRDKNELDQCVRVLEPEDVRSDFDEAFRNFQKSMDLFLPDPRALAFADELRWLGKIRQAASVRFRDQRLDISDCGEKVRKLIEESVVAEGIQVLVERVDIFSKEFGERLELLKTDEAKASEMEHAVRAEIHVRLDEDPAFYKSLREKLEAIIQDRKAKRIDAAQQLLKLQVLVDEMHGRARAAQSVGLSDTGLAIYGLLEKAVPSRTGERAGEYGRERVDEPRKELAALIEEAVAPQVAIVDWVQKEDIQREARARVKRQLRAANVPAERLDGLANEIVDLMKARRR